MRKSVKHAAVVGAALAVTVGAGAAYAAWSVRGAGNIEASATNAQALNFDGTVTVGDLYPGGSATGKVTINNPNPFPVKLTGMTLQKSFGNLGGGVSGKDSGCNADEAIVLSPNVGALAAGKEVPKNGQLILEVPAAVTMTNKANDFCQGAKFTYAVTVNGVSA
ncbi:hypothetical protein [Actinoplanes sp. URMC 104]|uniref:hypothetical protein n=1 Tax=Actinoplanes sp. URMC 104 TaxID=3423409 RepID=UPI003F1BEAF0